MSIPTPKKAAAVVAVALTAAVTASACAGSGSGVGGGSGGKVVLRWSTWGSSDDIAAFNDFQKSFEKDHPNISLRLEPVAKYEDYHPKLLTELSSKTAPDVFYVGDDYIGKFVKSGVLTPLNAQLSGPDSKTPLTDFFDGIYGGAKKDGTIYGVPNDTNPEVLWYDKKALASAGITQNPADLYAQGKWTMSTYLDMNSKLKAAKKTGSIFWNWYGSTYSIINGFGGKIWENGKYVAPTDPNARKALQTLADGYKNGTFLSADLLPDSNPPETHFIRHTAGFYAGGRWMIENLKKGGDLSDYDIVPFPSQTGAPMPGAVATSYLSINKDTKHPKEAFEFLTAFVSKEGQALREKSGSAVPSVKGADSLVLNGYPQHAQTFIDVRNTGFANYPDEVSVPGLTKAINDELLQLWQGKVGFDKAMTDLQNLAANPQQ